MQFGSEKEKLIALIPKVMERGKTDPVALVDSLDMIKALENCGAVDYFRKTQDREHSSSVQNELPMDTAYDPEAFSAAHDYNKRLRKIISEYGGGARLNGPDGVRLLQLYKDSLKFDSFHDFDAAVRYMEWERPHDKKFYEPRRKALLPAANALTELARRDLDLLAISLPPGVGKTTLAIFFVAWLAGKEYWLTNLISSHNDEFLRGVYDEILRITDIRGEYLWADMFRSVNRTKTNAKDFRIDFGTKKRFETVELTSIGSNNAGKVRATGLLYCDDLVPGIEQALSRDQMDKLWNKYTADLRQRKQGKYVRELHIATRWTIYDPIGRLMAEKEGDERCKFINVPAMDENDESNFDYPYGLGFTTKMYREQREIMDTMSWNALYMGEPVEREGVLYDPKELRRFFELPEKEPDAIISICDSKEQGIDYCVMPVIYVYGQDYYIDKFICDSSKVEVIEARVANMLFDKGVQTCQIESNRGGTMFAADVKKILDDLGGKTSITTKWTQTNKETRIQVNSGWVKEHCLFKDESLYKQDNEYRTAMNFLTKYTIVGKNKHDDVPDVLSMLPDYVSSFRGNKATILKRFF